LEGTQGRVFKHKADTFSLRRLAGTGSAFYSVLDAPRAARRHNATAQQSMLTPAPVAGPDRSTGFGLHLSGRF
jgi:hypothetical protein